MRRVMVCDFRVAGVWLVWLCCQVPVVFAEEDTEFFERRVRPILVQRCESCHSSAKGKTHGGLALDSQAGWKQGGDSGTAIVPGKIDDSLLIQVIRYPEDGVQMPPEEAGGKLPAAEIQVLVEWVRRGAPDPRVAKALRGGLTEQQLRDWWSFQPLHKVTVPRLDPSVSTGNEIDHFLAASRSAAGLTASPRADRRTLIRRVTYDLTGLPPTPQEVAAFVADESPTAYAHLIERLLTSPHYGERWGRHWLDLVRYADTAGENSDHPIPDAWRYRNWVINALNADLPYDVFVREQIAGDLIHKNDTAEEYAAGIVATGFLAIARRFDHDSDMHMHLTYEDTIDTVGRSFLGLSIACARCHDHKYDPISAADYYALYGILSSTRFAFPGCEAKQQPRDMVPLLTPAEWAQTIEPYEQKLAALDLGLKQLDERQAQATSALKSAALNSPQLLAAGEVSEGGSQFLAGTAEGALDPVTVKQGQWLQLTIDPNGNYGADSTLIEWELREVGGAERVWNITHDLLDHFLDSNPRADRYGNAATWALLDGRGGPSLLPETLSNHSGKVGLDIWRNGDNPAIFVNSTDQPITVWTTLPPRTLFVHPAPDGPVAVAWISPFEGQVRITGRVADAHTGGPNGVKWRCEQFAGDHSATLARLSEFNTQRKQLMTQRAELVAQAPAKVTAYAVTEGTIANARVHLRGDPEKLGDEVPRRWLELFGAPQVPAESGSGRLALAHWLTDPHNPLVSRVMVNRLWQHHFGKGLVATPNDFGTRGQAPTHPELLDWLAAKFIESGWSMKAMHRQMLLSAAYQQGAGDPETPTHAQALTVDPNNHLYWRFDRRRLTAEELRDSVLQASQQLDLTPGQAHAIPPTNTWSYTQHVPFAGVAETNQRSVYLMIVRNRRHPFLGLFDGADPNTTTPQRQVTTVPTQSLYFLNDAFFHGQAEAVARRLLAQPDESARLSELFQIVLQRDPTAAERASVLGFLSNYQQAIADTPAAEQPLLIWSACARLLLSSNEFLYLD